MKQLAILFVAVCAMSAMASNSDAQSFSYGSWGGGRGVSISVGSGGFYNPGFGHWHQPQFVGPRYGAYYAPIYRPVPVRPVYPVYGGWGGGWGGGCRHGW